jgi:hypothetical protein
MNKITFAIKALETVSNCDCMVTVCNLGRKTVTVGNGGPKTVTGR